MSAILHVAIPSNRVNVSYVLFIILKKKSEKYKGRNPLKSGQCFLLFSMLRMAGRRARICRNPLKSGQCFLLSGAKKPCFIREVGRNPLKSGQCFLLSSREGRQELLCPSSCRNPLKSGQCFLPKEFKKLVKKAMDTSRNPLKSGQCFLPL